VFAYSVPFIEALQMYKPWFGVVAPKEASIKLMRRFRSAAVIFMFAVAIMSTSPAPAETIESAMAYAYQNNPQLNAQRAAVRQTDEGVAQALSGYRPTIGATVNLGKEYTDTTEEFPPIPGTPLQQSTAVRIKGPTNPRSVGLNATQSLFNAKTPNQTRAAESQVLAARETLRVLEQSVLLSAATAYMDVLRDRANLEVQRSSVQVFQQMLKDTRMRRIVGQVTNTDVAQAEAQLAGAEATLHAAESTLMTTNANYRRVIGIAPHNLSPASPVDNLSPRTLAASIADAVVENPSVTAAIYGVDVAQLQVNIAEAGLTPTLTLQGNILKQYDTNITTPKLFDSSVMLSLSIPLYQGGREYSTIRQNKEAVGQQRLNLDQVRDQVRANVTQFWGQVDATKAEIEATERQVKASESALNGVRDEARFGERTTYDVLNAQQTLVNSRLNLLTAQHDRVLASYNLLSAVGRLSASALHLPVQIYDPAVHYHQVRDSWIGVRTPDGR